MIFWDLRQASEHADLLQGQPPPGLLSRPECVFFNRLRTAQRRREWLLGRWAAKGLCLAWLAHRGHKMDSCNLTIAPSADGSPYAIAHQLGPLPITISITHRDSLSACALVEQPRAAIGIDLERNEPRSPGFVSDFFTDSEVEITRRSHDPHHTATAIWSLKEATLKALRLGLTVDTRKIRVQPKIRPTTSSTENWEPAAVQIELEKQAHCSALIRDWEGYVLSIAWMIDPPPRQVSEAFRGWPVLPDLVSKERGPDHERNAN